MNEAVPHRVLVVDDEELNREIFEAMLAPFGYRVESARDGQEALEKVSEFEPDLILLDIMMPRMDGFEVLARLKEEPRTRGIPVVVVTALGGTEDRVEAFNRGADDFLSKPVDHMELRARVRSLLKVKAYNDHLLAYQRELEAAVARRTQDLEQALLTIKTASLDTILRLSRAAEYKDGETFSHVLRVSHYSREIARLIGLDEETAESILYSSPMHDIGKIGIPDHILLKPADLTREEEEVMRRHTVIGAKILEKSNIDLIRYAEVIALSHHEKWDGSGYPAGLTGGEIPLAARITTLADVFDALSTRRSYKRAYPIDECVDYVRRERGAHFDPALVDAFMDGLDRIRDIHERFSGSQSDLFEQWSAGPVGVEA